VPAWLWGWMGRWVAGGTQQILPTVVGMSLSWSCLPRCSHLPHLRNPQCMCCVQLQVQIYAPSHQSLAAARAAVHAVEVGAVGNPQQCHNGFAVPCGYLVCCPM
jgi:hypothetical protein